MPTAGTVSPPSLHLAQTGSPTVGAGWHLNFAQSDYGYDPGNGAEYIYTLRMQTVSLTRPQQHHRRPRCPSRRTLARWQRNGSQSSCFRR